MVESKENTRGPGASEPTSFPKKLHWPWPAVPEMQKTKAWISRKKTEEELNPIRICAPPPSNNKKRGKRRTMKETPYHLFQEKFETKKRLKN